MKVKSYNYSQTNVYKKYDRNQNKKKIGSQWPLIMYTIRKFIRG